VSAPFDVTVGTSSGETTGSAGLTSLLAGSSQTISITAPACTAGQRLRVVADAGGSVDEAMERNNSASPKCPSTA
jgi:subtilase family serine protease